MDVSILVLLVERKKSTALNNIIVALQVALNKDLVA